MPYARHYLKVLNDLDIAYDIIYWDRFKLNEDESWLRYIDNKTGHARGFTDYIAFTSFVRKTCKSRNYKRVVLFGIQLAFFLSEFIKSNYKGNYIWDIRDYHFFANFFKLGDFVRSANFVAISSPGYLDWLPHSNNYIICHNHYEEINNNSTPKNSPPRYPLVISYIGALRDYNLHSSFIKEVSNSSQISLEFHGRGIANETLSKFTRKNNINNVYITGHYDPKDENTLYERASITNALIPISGINNKSLLPNRLYRSIINKRPLLTLKGTQTACIVSQHQIGLVLEKITDCKTHILNYISKFDESKFLQNSNNFISEVRLDNKKFTQRLIDFMEQ